MRCTHTRRVLWSFGIVILLLMVSSTALAGSFDQEDPPPPDTETGPIPSLEPPEVLELAEGEQPELAGATVQEVQAAPAAEINYQGFLTDAGGSPLDGEYDMSFTLFDAQSDGTAVWGPEVHLGVPVSKGLFQVALGKIAPFDVADFKDQLYLETKVGATVLPRQMLRAVPYAMGLTLGARAAGASAAETEYGLYVVNGGGRGVYADAKGNGLIAIFSADRVYSAEGYSGPPTYLWAPGTDLELYTGDTTEAAINRYEYGLARINPSVDNATLYGLLPLQLERPYGRSYRLTHVTLYYKVGAPSFINGVEVQGRNFNTNTQLDAAVSDVDGNSTTYAAYEIDVDPPFVIDNVQTVTGLSIHSKSGTPNGQNGYIDIYGVRLTLQSNY